MPVCYLLHFSEPYRAGKHPGAQHYLGIALDDDPARRLARHLRGDGSPLVRAAVQAGSRVELVRTWPDTTRRDERRLKGRHGSRLCPTCALQRRLQPRLPLFPATVGGPVYPLPALPRPHGGAR